MNDLCEVAAEPWQEYLPQVIAEWTAVAIAVIVTVALAASVAALIRFFNRELGK